MNLPKEFRDHLAAIGVMGGKSRSRKKLKAIKSNLLKAQQARRISIAEKESKIPVDNQSAV